MRLFASNENGVGVNSPLPKDTQERCIYRSCKFRMTHPPLPTRMTKVHWDRARHVVDYQVVVDSLNNDLNP